jgi:hypothetical protein
MNPENAMPRIDELKMDEGETTKVIGLIDHFEREFE